MKKSGFEEKIKEAMMDETKDIKVSQDLMDQMMSQRNKTWKEKLNSFLNKEVEIPLVPVLVGIMGLFIITFIPKEIFSHTNTRMIDIGTSRIIIREMDEVVYHED